MKKEIITQRLRLSEIKEKDRTDLIRILSDEELGKTYMIPDMTDEKTRNSVFERYRALSSSENRFAYGVFLENRLIGVVHEVEVKDNEIELGYFIDPAKQGKGYATEALSAAVGALGSKGIAVTAEAFEENEASLRVMEKCGMIRTGFTEDIEYRGKIHKCIYMRTK